MTTRRSPVVVVTAAVVLVGSFLTMSVEGRSTHVPKDACDTMVPGHGGKPQTTKAPYFLEVTTAPTTTLVNVNIKAASAADKFKGFFVRAVNTKTGAFFGEFMKAPKTITCETPNDGAHHSSPALKESVDLTWQPPSGFSGSVIFNATVVKTFDTFWTGIESIVVLG